MASADQSLGDGGGEFEADDVQHVCTLKVQGGRRTIKNTGTKPAVIAFDPPPGLVLVLAQAAGKDARYLAAGVEEYIPATCSSIAFLAAAAANNTYLRVSART